MLDREKRQDRAGIDVGFACIGGAAVQFWRGLIEGDVLSSIQICGKMFKEKCVDAIVPRKNTRAG